MIEEANDKLLRVDYLMDIGRFVCSEIKGMTADNPERDKLSRGLESLFEVMQSQLTPAVHDLLDVESVMPRAIGRDAA